MFKVLSMVSCVLYGGHIPSPNSLVLLCGCANPVPMSLCSVINVAIMRSGVAKLLICKTSGYKFYLYSTDIRMIRAVLGGLVHFTSEA